MSHNFKNHMLVTVLIFPIKITAQTDIPIGGVGGLFSNFKIIFYLNTDFFMNDRVFNFSLF